jgi:hypothetical protein
MNKQIEEMARDLCECYNRDGTCYQDDKPCDFKCDEYTNAQYLYEKGYRKQSEGEWIKHPVSYECTACMEEFFVEGYAEDCDPITDWDLHFCPNCGARMKGENENE